MLAFRSKSPARLLLFVLLGLSLLLLVLPSIVQAQGDDDASDDDAPDTTPAPQPLEPPTSATTTSPAGTTNPTTTTAPPHPPATSPKPKPATGTSIPAPGQPTTVLPNPVFSTSDACVACQKEFYTIRNCSLHLPPVGVNLTVIVQLLPFYGCMCQNDYVEIDALQQCSNCFRSTGQQAFLSPQFYNFTNPGVKSFKKVCLDTANGSRVPNSAGVSVWDALKRSGSWMAISILVVVLLPLGGL